MRRSTIIVVLTLLVSYAALSHYSAVNENARGLATALSIGPVFVIGAALLWRSMNAAVALLVMGSVGVLLYEHWDYLKNHYEWSDLLQQCGIYLSIALAFVRSLFGDKVPLCTQIDLKLHADLSAAELHYLRFATLAWGCFYAALGLSIAALFFIVTPQAWSLYVNFVTFGLIALACFIDYGFRQRLLPQRTGSGLLSMLRRALLG